MAVTTKIQWCDHTWSPWRGCTKVSPGCANCYAEKLSHRNPAVLGEWGKDGKRVPNKNWRTLHQWDRQAEKDGVRRRVFPSLCDPFEDREDLEDTRDRFFGAILGTPNLDWLLLTKRPENVLPYFKRLDERRRGYWHEHAGYLAEAAGLTQQQWEGVVKAYGYPGDAKSLGDSSITKWPLPNLWLGVSVENQEYADERIPLLLQVPAAVRWVSYEPALGPVDWSSFLKQSWMPDEIVKPFSRPIEFMPVVGLDWIVVGGESGPKARPFDVAWARSTIRQCKAADVPCFVKQLGAEPFEVIRANQQHLLDRDYLGITDPKGGDIAEWEEDLRVQESPRMAAR